MSSFGWSIIGMERGFFITLLAKTYEKLFGGMAYLHLTVSSSMEQVLKENKVFLSFFLILFFRYFFLSF